MKICFLVNNLSLTNGWGRYAYSLINCLEKSGVEVKILASVKAGEENLEKFRTLKILPPLFVSRIVKVFYLLKNFFVIRRELKDCEIIHVLTESYIPLVYLMVKNKPYFVTAHGTYAVHPLSKKYLFNIYKKAYQKAKKIICVSSYTQKKILEKIKLTNTIVTPNGVDLTNFLFVDKGDKKAGEQISILSVGVLIARKGFHLVIAALAKLKQNNPEIKFNYTIIGRIGSKNYYNQLCVLVEQNNLGGQVIFRQNLSDEELVGFYQKSDLFILTPEVEGSTKFEGFGQVYLEAMACGLPVMASKKSAVEDFLVDNQNGFLVNAESNDIYFKLAEILKEPVLLRKVAEKGRVTALKFDWHKIILKYLESYEIFG